MADSKLTGSSGEHFACYALARQGWIASLVREGLERTDILAVDATTRRMVEIQVKTTVPVGKSTWMIGAGGLILADSDHEWYVFVAMIGGLTDAPTCFVVPRNHVAAAAWIMHNDWLTDPTAKPGTRNTPVTKARVPFGVWTGYEARWDLLQQPTVQVPVLLPAKLRELAQEDRVGLPPGHPWATSLPVW